MKGKFFSKRGIWSALIAVLFLFSSQSVFAEPDSRAGEDSARVSAAAAGTVTPDDFKTPASGEDDTDCVQAAFDSGKTVVFTRDYYVRSVEMRGDTQTIDFNGYWLYGTTAENGTDEDKDAILKITGIYLELYDLKIGGGFNTNYRAAIHWFSRPNRPQAAFINVYGLYIRDILVGIQYGAWLDETAPYDTAQSENYISGFRMRGIQNVIISNQPNGFLKISDSTLDCHAREWTLQADNPFDENASYLIHCKIGQVTIENSELLKVLYLGGYGLIGQNIVVNNCVMEMPCTWVRAQGDVTLDGVHGGFMGGNAGVPMFEVAPGAFGSLRVQNVRMSRSLWQGIQSGTYVVNGLNAAPQYRAYIQNCDLGEWLPSHIAIPSERQRVMVESTALYWLPELYVQGERQTASVDDKLPQANWLSGIDVTGEGMTGAQDTADKAGWHWTNLYGGGQVYFRGNTADKPAGARSAIEVCATGESNIQSPKFTVPTGGLATFKAWSKITNGGGHAGIALQWYKADGSPASVAETQVLGTLDMLNDWNYGMVMVAVPADAATARVRITAEVGTVSVSGMGLYSTADHAVDNSLINEWNNALNNPGDGFVLRSPNGTAYKITVDDNGQLAAQAYPE